MNCRDFILEFEERNLLSKVAQQHFNDCPNCRQTTIVQTHIWEAITDFPPINAPQNFDFKVKAKIANHRPPALKTRYLPVLRYVLPFSAIVLMLGLLVFNTSLFVGDNSAKQVAQATPSTPISAESSLDAFSLPAQPVAVGNPEQVAATNERIFAKDFDQTVKPASIQRETPFTVAKSARKTSVARRKEIFKDNSEGIGSNDKALTTAPVLMPEGINANKPREISPNNSNAPSVATEAIWAFVGIEIVSQNGNRTVKAVKQNSFAARSGLRAGDVITAVDGIKLSAAPISTEKIEIKSLTVRRGSEETEVMLKN